jgi:multidrug resistance protein
MGTERALSTDLEKQQWDGEKLQPPDRRDSEEPPVSWVSQFPAMSHLLTHTQVESAIQHPPKDETLDRVTTHGSTKSKISRVVTRLTTRTKKEKERLEPEKIPVTDLDAGLIGWEGQDDPEMPLNFSHSRKWLLLSLLSSITLISPLASSMFAPGVSFMDETFHNDNLTISSFTVSIFVLGYAVGPLFLSPLSEIYGRRPVLGCANMLFCVWQIGCALAPSISTLIVFRFFAGIGGSGCLTIGGGVISDLFRREQRGTAMALYSLGPLMGPVIGPICGGFIAERAGWRCKYFRIIVHMATSNIFQGCFGSSLSRAQF